MDSLLDGIQTLRLTVKHLFLKGLFLKTRLHGIKPWARPPS